MVLRLKRSGLKGSVGSNPTFAAIIQHQEVFMLSFENLPEEQKNCEHDFVEHITRQLKSRVEALRTEFHIDPKYRCSKCGLVVRVNDLVKVTSPQLLVWNYETAIHAMAQEIVDSEST